MTKQNEEIRDHEVDSILESLTGMLRVGVDYYFFLVTYHFIGRVKKINEWGVELEDALAIAETGSGATVLTDILSGKKLPDSYERVDSMIIALQSIAVAFPMKARASEKRK